MAEIHVSGLSKSYPLSDGSTRQALKDIDLHVAAGEFVCLLGPSGCGKTTLLNILAGLDTADSGRVSVGDPAAPPTTSYMFQEPRLLPWRTVLGNLLFVLDEGGDSAKRKAEFWLERVGLPGRGNDFPRQLSIGQRQRVAVARALIAKPDVLFMDEPFSSLDELTATRMREELLDLWHELGCTVVFVTHNPLEAAFLADRIVVMSPGPGRIVQQLQVTGRLPRPRDADDTRLWEVSREAVRALRGTNPTPEAVKANGL